MGFIIGPIILVYIIVSFFISRLIYKISNNLSNLSQLDFFNDKSDFNESSSPEDNKQPGLLSRIFKKSTTEKLKEKLKRSISKKLMLLQKTYQI